MAERVKLILPWAPAIQPTWTVAQVRSALNNHELGQFADSAKLWSAMGRDDRLSATMATRIDGLLGAPCEMVAEDSDDKRAATIAEEIGADWPTIAPREQLADLIDWHLGVGVGLARLVEQRQASRWIYTLDVWDPQFLTYSGSERKWSVTTQDGQQDIEPGKDGWIIWSAGPRGWMHGMVRSLAVPWLMRQFAWRDWASYSERHGMPIVKALVPATAEAHDKAQFAADIRALSTETTVTLPQGPNGPGESYDLSLLEATSNTWEGFERLITACNVTYAVRVLGQNLTTEIQGGSYAASKTADQVRTDVKKSDAEAVYALARAQILPLTAEANYGKGAPVPGPSYDVEPAENLTENATAARALGDALSSFKTAGYEVKNLPEVAEKFGLELDEVEPPEPPPVPVPPVPPQPPPAAPDAPSVGEDMPGDASAPQGTPGDANGDEQQMADRCTCGREHGTVALASGDSPADAPGFVAGQLWVDALGDDGIARTAKALQPDLAAVKAVIDNSESFDEVRTKLLKLYRGMLNPESTMRLLERAMILGEIAGRWSVSEDL